MAESMSGELLDDVLTGIGQAKADGVVTFTGEDPVLPSIFRIGEVGAAVIAANALQAARIWQTQTGRTQDITVATDAAAAGMRSARYLRPDPAPTDAPRRGAGGLGIYRTSDDRWIYFQRLFAHHRARLFEVLACDGSEDAIVAAVAGWKGLELEQAVVDNGATAGMVRTPAEWAQHEQSHVIAGQPLVEIVRIGDSPPTPLPRGDRPLSGLRVVDATRVLAGPTCGRTLAEYGADVLRVGSPHLPDNEDMMRDTGHGKRSCALDLKTADGAAQMRELIAGADVFSQGYRPGAMDHLGFSPEEVAALRPGIISVSISAYGHQGPWRERRGFDSVVQSVNGLADRSAIDGVPKFLPANSLDYMTGYLAAAGVMAAITKRAAEGGSYLVRVSLARTGKWLAELPTVDHDLVAMRPPELDPKRLDELMMTRETSWGPLRYLAPIAQLTDTPGFWALPTAPLDQDPPSWS
jgi:crotonobetainyl-CoA:carnitine CoA-transferase CaiB-like acyl-CoA transferase